MGVSCCGFGSRRQDRADRVARREARRWDRQSSLSAEPHFDVGPRLGFEVPLFLLFAAARFSGFTSATTVPGEMPLRIARPSLTAWTLTSCISKLRLRLQYTTFLPSCSKTAPPGIETARERLSPRIFRRTAKPGCSRGSA